MDRRERKQSERDNLWARIFVYVAKISRKRKSVCVCVCVCMCE